MNTTTAPTKKDQHAESAPEVGAGGAQAPKANTPSDCKLGNVPIDFDQIQGNIFGGFLKDHQVNILLEVKANGANDARQTLLKGELPGAPDSIITHVQHSTSKQVIDFNEQFRAIRHAGLPEGSILATWTNIVFTGSGMKKFGAGTTNFPKAFTDRMEKRKIGDVGGNAPTHWNDGMDVIVAWDKVDVMIILASDDPAQLDRLASRSRLAIYLARLNASTSGFNILGIIRGETRVDAGPNQVGHEHFGFKDGVSQPGVRGVDSPDDSLHNPDQGNPGQDLLHPGEFVLGYPRQIPSAEVGVNGPNPCQGKISGKEFEPTDPPDSQVVLPDWAKNGSFLVFRRLAQDVKGFRDAVVQNAGTLGLTTDLLGAKLVGRYRSGAPLEALKFQSGIGEYQPPENDPGAATANPALANSNALNNDFEYGEDPDGNIVPLAAHIRKAYPRDQVPAGGSATEGAEESKTHTHRLLRRGIPFGMSLGAAESGGADDPRGLLFFAYQSDIERQFEFVQKTWVNNADFPKLGAGQDPIITNSTPSGPISGCPFHALADKAKCPAITFTHFVKTRGGGYFFSPSISALKGQLGLG
jgi:Dyp-type peroxidase family